MSNVSKLAELRGKTDRQLIHIINNELELGLHLTLTVETSFAYDFSNKELPHVRAEKACDDALRLLSKVDDISERQRLQRKLDQLREALNGQRRVQAAAV